MYSDFVKVILDFQLQEHEKFLNSFTTLFKQIDTDNNGIISEDELKELLFRMQVVPNLEEQLETLFNIIDPHNNKQMTYSEVVQLLSTQMTPISDENPRMVPLLEKYVNQMQIMRDLGHEASQDGGLSSEMGGARRQIFNDESEQQFQQKYYELFGGSTQDNNQFADPAENHFEGYEGGNSGDKFLGNHLIGASQDSNR